MGRIESAAQPDLEAQAPKSGRKLWIGVVSLAGRYLGVEPAAVFACASEPDQRGRRGGRGLAALGAGLHAGIGGQPEMQRLLLAQKNAEHISHSEGVVGGPLELWAKGPLPGGAPRRAYAPRPQAVHHGLPVRARKLSTASASRSE